MREPGYHPIEMALSLAKKSSNLIGLLVLSALYRWPQFISRLRRLPGTRWKALSADRRRSCAC